MSNVGDFPSALTISALQSIRRNVTNTAYEAYTPTASGGVGISQLAELTDVNVAGVINGQVLTYDDGTSKWVPATSASGGGAGDMLKSDYDSNDDGIVNQADSALTVAWGDISDKPISDGDITDLIDGGETTLHTHPASGGGATTLAELTDVDVTGADPNDSLVYDGSKWTPVAVSGTSGGSFTAYLGTQIYRTVVGAGGVASIDITSISDSYDELRLFFYGRTEWSSGYDVIWCTFNADTNTTHYRMSEHWGGGTYHDVVDDDSRRLAYISGDKVTTGISSSETVITGYASTAFHKVARTISAARDDEDGVDSVYMIEGTLFWESTAAINRITLITESTDKFAEGSIIILVGYKNTTITL